MKFELRKPAFNKEFFILLLPVFFVWHGFVENYVSVSVNEAANLLIDYLLSVIVLFAIFYWLFRSWRKTSIFVFLLMAYYFFFGAVHDFAKRFLEGSFLVKYSFILPFSLIAFIVLAVLIRRTKSGFSKLTRFLNLLLLVLILIEIPVLLKAIKKANERPPLEMGLQVCDTCKKPDVYLIVADEYAGGDQLREMFEFDNSAFENQLVSRGFHIVPGSRSNYDFTPFSISSMLSMNYLQNIVGRNSSKQDMNICSGLINHNNLWNFFKTNGYSIINNSIFHVNNQPTKVPQGFLFMGTRLITSQTFVSRFNMDIRFNLVTKYKVKSEIRRMAYLQQRSNQKVINGLMNELKDNPDKPRFVYTHLLMPHYPYYNDSKGNLRSLEFLSDINNYRNKQAYLEYLQYCNGVFIQMIDAILANSKQPPVIIFMSDHGYRMDDKADDKYRFMNFNSILIPSRNYDSFYKGMSNINQFRTLLNVEFGQQLPILKDSLSRLRD
jgi:hypothetical protein